MFCTKCKVDKSTDNFSTSKKEIKYKQYQCKECNKAYRQENKIKIRDYQLKYKFGISLDLYMSILKEQNYSCAICQCVNASGRDLAVDHNHTTGEVRGLLCSACNSGLGHFRDSIYLISKAQDYLQKGKKYG